MGNCKISDYLIIICYLKAALIRIRISIIHNTMQPRS